MNETPSFEDLVERFLDQCRAGDAPGIEDFAAQHPEYTTRLRELLPLLRDMEGLGGGAARTAAAVPPADADLPELPGSDYRLLRKIGQGGMGVVYEALQISLDRKVAVKLLSPALVKDAAMRAQFERESRVIAMLHHPNIVRVISAGDTCEAFYYAMELVDGQGLDRVPLSDPRDIAEVGLQAAKALAYAHACDVLHCDIKPANLLLDAERNVRVSDFGLAFVLQHGSDWMESGGSLRGTLRYMAPEKLEKGISSFATDQYALGMTLYELVAQAPAVSERTPQEMMKRIGAGPLPPLECNASDLAAIINKAVAFHPEHRYAGMERLAEDLQHFLDHEPVSAAPPSAGRRVFLWARRKPALAALGLAALAGAAAFVIALLVGYARTTAALAMAEKNAAVADATLSSVFAHIERQPPTQSGADLLSSLMPYYQGIARQRDLPNDQLARANQIIGTSALRAGDYPLAEGALRRLSEIRADAFPLNQLAEALRRQGKTSEADAIARRVAEQFAEAENPDDRLEAVRALKTLSGDPKSAEIKQAFQLLETLLRAAPANSAYRFEFAALLAAHPRTFRAERIPGVEPNAVVLLGGLSADYPDRPEYGLALVELMRRRIRYTRDLDRRDLDDLALAVETSNRLLGRFPNTPEVISSTVRFRDAYIGALRRNKESIHAIRETERLLGMLEILVYNPEAPAAAAECLIQLKLQQWEYATRDGRARDAARLATDIQRHLDRYDGARAEEFRSRLAQSTPTTSKKD